MLPSRRITTMGGDKFRDEYSLAFDGTDDYIVTDFKPDYIHTNATFAMWVKMNDFTGSQTMGAHGNKRWYMGFSGTNGFLGVADANNQGSPITITPTPVAGQWIHYAVTAHNGTATLYINGVAQGTMSYTQSSGSNPDKGLLIGARYASDNSTLTSQMNCSISEVVQYSTALSKTAIKTIYNGREPYNHNEGIVQWALKAWYRMGDEQGNLNETTNKGVSMGLIAEQTNKKRSLLKAWDFSSDEDGWEDYSGNTVEHSTTITNHLGGSGVLKCIGGDASDYWLGKSENIDGGTMGIEGDKHYLITYYLYVPTSWSGTDNFRVQEASMTDKNYTKDVSVPLASVKDSWQYGAHIFSPDSSDVAGALYLYTLNTNNLEADDFVYLSGVKLYEWENKNHGAQKNMSIADLEGDTP